jgi:hypothetical protein
LRLFSSDDSFFRSLDSSVKRNTAAIKKLRALSEETRVALLEELKGVNLTKYVSEAVAAVVEAKLKTADMNAAVQVCLFRFFVYGIFHRPVCSVNSCCMRHR